VVAGERVNAAVGGEPATLQLNVAWPSGPEASVAVTVTVESPAVVGVPEISPLDWLIPRPAGSPLTT